MKLTPTQRRNIAERLARSAADGMDIEDLIEFVFDVVYDNLCDETDEELLAICKSEGINPENNNPELLE